MFKRWYQVFLDADGAGAGGGEPGDGGTPPPVDNPAGDGGQPQEQPPAPSPADEANSALLGGGDGNQQQEQGGTVPDAYEFKLDEGMVMDEATGKELTAIGKELGISQDGMDKLLTLHNKTVQDMLAQATAVRDQNLEECQKQGLLDKGTLAVTGDFIKRIGSPEALNALLESGVIYNPHVMKMFQGLALLVKEDSGADGKPAASEKDIVDLLYK